jgi:uncharacterized membrane protein YhaH (DUF805 family)
MSTVAHHPPYHPLTLFSFAGRIGRLQYLVGSLYLIVAGTGIAVVGLLVEPVVGRGTPGVALGTVLTIPALAMLVQRMRDFGMKWWWLLVIHGTVLLGNVVSYVLDLHSHAFDSPVSTDMQVMSVAFLLVGIIGFAGVVMLWLAVLFYPGKSSPIDGIVREPEPALYRVAFNAVVPRFGAVGTVRA